MERELRKRRDDLMVIGSGFVLLGIWDMIKTAAAFVMENGNVVDEAGDGMQIIARIILFAFAFVVGGIDFLIRYYIGKSAIAEGQGLAKKNGYLVLAGILLFLSVINVVYCIFKLVNTGTLDKTVLSNLVTIFVDITICAVTAVLIYSAFRSRALAKKLGE